MKRIMYSTVGGTNSYHRDTKWFILYEALSNAYTKSCPQNQRVSFPKLCHHIAHFTQSARGFMITSAADFAAT